MSTPLQEKAAKAAELLQGTRATAPNPTESRETVKMRTRIPLSVPMRKLEVPEIPGYYTKWFRGTPARIAQAERAGFEFVHPDEVRLNNVSIGGDAKKDGNTDLGARVSVIEGSEVDGAGQAVRLYLMKQRMEHKLEDDAIAQARNDQTVAALTASFRQGSVGGQAQGETREDMQQRYVDPRRTKIPDLFRKKPNRS